MSEGILGSQHVADLDAQGYLDAFDSVVDESAELSIELVQRGNRRELGVASEIV
ncbi:hypothetical protein OD997_14485 [Microbacterium sp. CGR1]